MATDERALLTATTVKKRLTTTPVVLVLLVVVPILVGACGNERNQAQTRTEVQASARDDLMGDSWQRDLAGTLWNIVEMTGFPDDNVADGTFRFSDEAFKDGFEGEEEWLGHYDGVNWSSSSIQWNESGFTVTGGGDTTAMLGPEGENRYLQTFFNTGARIEIVQNNDGSLTLIRDDLNVTADGVRLTLQQSCGAISPAHNGPSWP